MKKTVRNMIIGAAQMLDFSGGLAATANRARVARVRGLIARSDKDAIASDFVRVGESIRVAMGKYQQNDVL